MNFSLQLSLLAALSCATGMPGSPRFSLEDPQRGEGCLLPSGGAQGSGQSWAHDTPTPSLPVEARDGGGSRLLSRRRSPLVRR